QTQFSSALQARTRAGCGSACLFLKHPRSWLLQTRESIADARGQESPASFARCHAARAHRCGNSRWGKGAVALRIEVQLRTLPEHWRRPARGQVDPISPSVPVPTRVAFDLSRARWWHESRHALRLT